jgi:hypothetical protein
MEALRALANQQEQQPAPPAGRSDVLLSSFAWPRLMRPRWIALGSGALIICLLVGALIWLRPALSHPPAVRRTPIAVSDPLVLRISRDGIGCPQRAAWSPDGGRIAAVGFAAKCRSDTFPPNSGALTGSALAIYNAATGNLLQMTDIGAPILAAHIIPPSALTDPAALSQVLVLYDQLLWSPDGRQVALTFDALPATQESYDPSLLRLYGRGLLTVQDSGAAHMFLLCSQERPPPEPQTSFASLPACQMDLTSGVAMKAQVPQALGYAWSAAGTLVPTQPLPTSPSAPAPTPTTGPIGSPDGGASFSVWQIATVEYTFISANVGPGTLPAGCVPTNFYVATYGTPAAWSPDGRYLILPAAVYTRIGIGASGRISAPTSAAPNVQQACTNPTPTPQWAKLPVRDAGLTSALGMVDPYPYAALSIAWNESGQCIAVLHNTTVIIYDTATGNVLVQFTVDQLERSVPHSPSGSSFAPPQWSPDGKRLLMMDTGNAILILLGPRSLAG